MKWQPFCLVALALLSTTACSRSRSPAAASARPRGPAEEDLEKLQGAWRIDSSWRDGVPEPEAARGVTILFRGDKFIVVDKDGNRQEETIRLMPDRTPKAIDCWSKGGGQASPGIYELEGDTFRWCSPLGSPKVRPAGFSSQTGSRQYLLVLRREKNWGKEW
jgi:uncharacterized protein (TIGR03067 family)